MAKKSVSEKIDFLKKNVFSSKANGKSYPDERFWVPTRNDKGEATALIRFLPNKDENSLPFVRNYKHSIRVEQNNFVDRCLTTIGKDCPICDWNKDHPKDFVKENATYRKTTFIHNILVINDPGNPENNGKVFLFEFGKQLFSVLKESSEENTEDNPEDAVIYFDFEYGANIKLKVKKDNPTDAFPTWAHSKFAAAEPIEKTLNALNITLDEVKKSLYDLEVIVKEANYKDYDGLKAKFNAFLAKSKLEAVNVEKEESKEEEKAAEEYARKKEQAMTTTANEPEEKTSTSAPKENKKTNVDKKMEAMKGATNFFSNFAEDDD
jgi:hypothetical protein